MRQLFFLRKRRVTAWVGALSVVLIVLTALAGALVSVQFHEAVAGHQNEVVELVQTSGADSSTEPWPHGDCLLHTACGAFGVVQLSSVDVARRTSDRTPQFEADHGNGGLSAPFRPPIGTHFI